MKLKEIQKIAENVTRKYYDTDCVTVERGTDDNGTKFVEVRTELTLLEGGTELMSQVQNKLGYESCPMGGCIYHFYANQEQNYPTCPDCDNEMTSSVTSKCNNCK
jgi:hypothetical protein